MILCSAAAVDPAAKRISTAVERRKEARRWEQNLREPNRRSNTLKEERGNLIDAEVTYLTFFWVLT